MRKHIIASILGLIGSLGLHAQLFDIPSDTLYQGCPPDSVHLYLFADSLKSTTYSYDTIPYYTIPVGGTSVTMSDDQVLGPFPVGFEVSWFCGSYTTFYICSNGWIGFQNTTAAFTPQAIPSVAANVPKNSVMGVWRDWNPGVFGGPYITYQTIGTAPNRKLVVTWSSVPMFLCSTTYGTFQIVVHETSNIIHTNITNVPTCLGWVNGDGVHGIHDPTGTYGLPVFGRNDTPFTTNNESLRFIPTSPVTWTTQNGNVLGIGNDLWASIPQSQYVYANATKCDNTPVEDSVYIQSSCIKLLTDSIDIPCTGDSTGVLIAQDTSSSLTPPYTFYWMDQSGDTIAINGSTNQFDTVTNVKAGEYSVVLANGGGFAVGTVTVNEPDTIAAFTSQVQVLCNGQSTGKAIAVDTNDYSNIVWNGLYNYEWSDGTNNVFQTANSDTLHNLPVGTYDVTIDGCFVQVGSVTISEPAVLIANIVSPTATSCPGVTSCDASATANAFGGVAPYSYLWSSGETTQVATQLCPGLNYVTITDANGCDSVASVDIQVPDDIVTSAFGDTLICITNIAPIAASSIGGTPPYNYIWTLDSANGDSVTTGSNVGVAPVLDQLYFVSSTDANGCPGDTSTVLVKVRPELGVELPELDTICPYDNISINVQGTGGDSNYTYSWSSGDFGNPLTVSPDMPTWYYLTVSDGCNTPVHVDSIHVQVGGYGDIQAQISVTDDTICLGESVQFTAEGRGGFRGPAEYRYKWNNSGWNGNSIQTGKPQTTRDYIVTISDLCLSVPGTDTVTIYVGEKEYPEYDAEPFESCKNAEVEISVEDYNPRNTYNWFFGDQETRLNAQNAVISHKYDESGCYDVRLELITEYGCVTRQSVECLVRILEDPIANFSNSPKNPSTSEPFIQFTNTSTNSNKVFWYIDSALITSDEVFSYEFEDTGSYSVTIRSVSIDGCSDTLTKFITKFVSTTVFTPGSFSPNNDNLNDTWGPIGEAIKADGYELSIYDRWGKLLFYSQDPSEKWDGKSPETNQFVPMGTYPYSLRFIDKDNEPKVIAGQIVVSVSGNKSGL